MSYNELKQHGTPDFPIELYYIDKLHPKYEMAHHWHNNIEIIRILEGSITLTLNDREIHAGKGDIIFVNIDTVHGGIPDECIYECIVFSLNLINCGDTVCNEFINNLQSQNTVINDFFTPERKDIKEITDDLFTAMENKSTAFHIMSVLYKLFAVICEQKLYKEVFELNPFNSKKNAKLKKVLSFIRNSYDSPITLSEMASEINMNKKYFCHFFKEMTQKTPISYLNAYRIEHASRKLLYSDEQITDIAYSCGFNDLSYFIKTFKSIKGVTPKEFRKTNKL